MCYLQLGMFLRHGELVERAGNVLVSTVYISSILYSDRRCLYRKGVAEARKKNRVGDNSGVI